MSLGNANWGDESADQPVEPSDPSDPSDPLETGNTPRGATPEEGSPVEKPEQKLPGGENRGGRSPSGAGPQSKPLSPKEEADEDELVKLGWKFMKAAEDKIKKQGISFPSLTPSPCTIGKDLSLVRTANLYNMNRRD